MTSPFELASKIKETTGEFPPIHQIAGEVLRLTSSSEVTTDQLSKVMMRDPALTSRVLKLANSCFYSRGAGVRNVRQAILEVGFGGVRALVMTASIRSLIPSLGRHEKTLWEHSIGCALAARLVAMRIGYGDPEQAYVAGLLHDIGKTILLLKVPNRMRPIVDAVLSDRASSFHEREEAEFGFDHATLGQFLAREWRLDQETEEAIGTHHFPEEAVKSPSLSHLICLANDICHRLGIGPNEREIASLSDTESAKFLALEGQIIDSVAREVQEGISAEMKTLIS